MDGNPSPRIGFLGLGRMGSRIAANLAGSGAEVGVWNRTPAVAGDWVASHGGRAATTPAELADSSDLLFTMLADGDALLEVVGSDQGLVAGLAAGDLVVDMGTSGPVAFGRAREMVETAGATMLDAPVSGSTAAAEAATLLVMVGGTSEDFARLEPILSATGRPLHVGPAGSATVLKLAVNSVLYGLNQAVAEAVALAEEAGVTPETTVDVLTQSAAGAPMLGYRRQQYLEPEEAPLTFTIDLVRKDVALAVEEAQRAGVAVAQLERTLEIIDSLIARGFGGRDMGYAVEANRHLSH